VADLTLRSTSGTELGTVDSPTAKIKMIWTVGRLLTASCLRVLEGSLFLHFSRRHDEDDGSAFLLHV
jgi:hypothetical protein